MYLLQSSIRIPLGESGRGNGPGGEAATLRLFGGDVHRARVVGLVAEARRVDPTLPTLDSVTSDASHVDVYGFRHAFGAEEELALHYLCTQLHLHYQAGLESQHKARWKAYLGRAKTMLVNSEETRRLVRAGIPSAYRSGVWRWLVHQQVVDLKLKFGKYYYRNLISSLSAPDLESVPFPSLSRCLS